MTTSKKSTTSAANKSITYDSNPFTLSIHEFGLFTKYAMNVFIMTLVFGVISIVLNFFSNFITSSSQSSSSSEGVDIASTAPQATEIIAIIVLFLAIFAIFMTIGLVINTLYKGTVAAAMVAASQKRKISLSEAFSEMGQRFGTLFFANILAWLRVTGGYLLFIVPGIRAQARYEALPYIVLENKHMTATQAVNESKRLYEGHLVEALAIMIFGSFVPFIGASFAAAGMTLSYQQIREYKDAGMLKPDMHILNWVLFYIVFGFIALIFLLIVPIIVLIAATAS